jgi:hypothetical protein
MRCQLIAAAMLVAASPYVLAQDKPADSPKDHEVTIQGCVVPGLDNTYVMTHVMEKPGAGGAVMPDMAHGRRVMFWLKNDSEVKSHPNQMVEVTGHFTDLKESEIEVKTGPRKDGGLIVEFEGPGKDVKAANETIGAAVGTAGRNATEKNDLKTYLAEVNVTSVRVVGSDCK